MIEGWEQWRRRLPDYRGWRLLALPLLVAVSTASGLGYLVGIETLPLLASRPVFVTAVEPVLPPVGTATVLLAGFLGVSRMWVWRDRFLAESRETAYQRAVPFGLTGVGLLLASILGGFVPVYQLSPAALGHPLSELLSTPVLALVSGVDSVGWGLRAALGLAVFGLGVLQAARSVRAIGMDSAALVSLYYPGESEMEEHAIYSVIRHPIYASWLLAMAGSALFRLSVYGALDVVLFSLAVVVWLRRVEEPELIERFGDDYREYRETVPALVPRPDALGDYLAFLLGRN